MPEVASPELDSLGRTDELCGLKTVRVLGSRSFLGIAREKGSFPVPEEVDRPVASPLS